MTKTKLNRANKNSKSLRTTVPEWVIDTLRVKVGDRLHWKIERETGRIYIEPVKE